MDLAAQAERRAPTPSTSASGRCRQIVRGSVPRMPLLVMIVIANDSARPSVQAKRLGFAETQSGGWRGVRTRATTPIGLYRSPTVSAGEELDEEARPRRPAAACSACRSRRRRTPPRRATIVRPAAARTWFSSNTAARTRCRRGVRAEMRRLVLISISPPRGAENGIRGPGASCPCRQECVGVVTEVGAGGSTGRTGRKSARSGGANSPHGRSTTTPSRAPASVSRSRSPTCARALRRAGRASRLE